ncbi:Tetraspanin-18 [Bienertia sinuspersici]
MRTNCCQKLLAFNLKFLNFLQFFVGISTVIYSLYLLNQWHNHAPIVPSPPPPAPSPNYLIPLTSIEESLAIGDKIEYVDIVSGSEMDLTSQLRFVQLPAPWFIYFLLVVGVLLCSMSCIGHVAAEAFNGFCLCFYIVFAIVLILLEAASVAFIAIDQQWDKDLPNDPTGELEKFKYFVEKNADICEWLGIALLTVQALSLLLSLVLRATISNQREDDDVEDGDAASRDRAREPLLNSQSNQSSMTMKNEGRGTVSDIWTSRIRQKYGLNNDSSKNQSQNAASSTNP